MRWQMWACTWWAVILSALVLQDVEGQGRVKCAELEGQQGEEPPPEIYPTQETSLKSGIVRTIYILLHSFME